MAKKGNLFFLVKSLTKSEKRYFKIFCFNQKVNNNYLRLFEALDKQETFDEEAIKKKFKGEKFVKQLHVTKNYLHQLILKSLRNYQAESTKNAALKDLLCNVEILYFKELFDQCHYELQKADRLARTYDYLPGLLEVLGWKRRLLLSRWGNKRPELNAIIAEEKEVLDELERLNQYWNLTINVVDYRDDEKGTLLEKPCLKHPEKATSLASKTLCHHILYTYHTINGRPQKGAEALEELIAVLEERPERIQNDPGPYATALNNRISAHIFAKEYDQAILLLQKVKTIPTRFKLKAESKFTIKLGLRTYNIELEVYRDTRQFAKGVALIPEIEKYLEQRQKVIPEQYFLQFWFQFAYVYFMARDFSKAQKWVNEIINTNFKDTRMDLQSYIRILNLMIHFEMDNTFVLKYAVDSCRRFLKKKKESFAFEPVLLRFFSSISNAPRSEFKSMFRELQQNLFDVDPPLVTHEHLDYLDLKTWIERWV